MHPFENQAATNTSAALLHRGDLLLELQNAVDACLARGGGVVALVGAPGCGKSMLAHQFVCENNQAVYFDALADDGGMPKAAPELRGISVLDEAWQFEGVAEAVQTHVWKNHGVVVLLSCTVTEARALSGGLLRDVVQVSHWSATIALDDGTKSTHDASSKEAVGLVVNSSKRRGVIRFRSPTGDTWTGVGRTPKWLVALEANGLPREQFRVNNSPLPRKRLGPTP